MQLIVHGADPQAATGIDAAVVEAVVEAAFDVDDGLAMVEGQILREQMRAISRQGLAAEELAIVGGDVMDARRRVEGLMQPAVDVDPPQLAGAVAPQWRLAENIRAGDGGLDPMRG